MPKTTQNIVSPCPNCGAALNAAISLDEGPSPEPGDIGICVKCRDLHIFDDNLDRRAVTEADLDDMPLDLIAYHQKMLTQATVNK